MYRLWRGLKSCLPGMCGDAFSSRGAGPISTHKVAPGLGFCGGEMWRSSSTEGFFGLAGQYRTFFTAACKQGRVRFMNPDGESYVGLNLTPEEKKRRAMANAKLVRQRTEFRRSHMSPEARLIWKLESTRRKLAIQQMQLKKLSLPPDEESEHDPEILTPEQLFSLKKIATINKNYVPVGIRGIFGGTIENMHMHWKFHQTCQVDLHMFPKEEIREMAKELARLSGGIVVDIVQKTVLMYRGRNYRQPDNLIPENQLNKREALVRAKILQSKRCIESNIDRLTARLERLRQESDVAGLVQRIAFSYPMKEKKKEAPRSRIKPYEYHEYTEDILEAKDEKRDSDEILVGGMLAANDLYTSADDYDEAEAGNDSDEDD